MKGDEEMRADLDWLLGQFEARGGQLGQEFGYSDEWDAESERAALIIEHARSLLGVVQAVRDELDLMDTAPDEMVRVWAATLRRALAATADAPQPEAPLHDEGELMPEPLNPCPSCGEHINPQILASSPECPHGWEAVTGPADLADLHAEAWTAPPAESKEQR